MWRVIEKIQNRTHLISFDVLIFFAPVHLVSDLFLWEIWAHWVKSMASLNLSIQFLRFRIVNLNSSKHTDKRHRNSFTLNVNLKIPTQKCSRKEFHWKCAKNDSAVKMPAVNESNNKNNNNKLMNNVTCLPWTSSSGPIFASAFRTKQRTACAHSRSFMVRRKQNKEIKQ